MTPSIRFQILIPLVVTIIVGFGSAALVGYQAMLGQGRVEGVVQQAVSAKMLAARTEQEFKSATEVVDRVLAMTNFVSAAEVKNAFEATNGALEKTLSELSQNRLSASLTQGVQALIEKHAEWKKDVRVSLGLDPATEVPTAEKLARSQHAFVKEMSALNAIVDQVATDSVASAGSALISKIEMELVAAGVADDDQPDIVADEGRQFLVFEDRRRGLEDRRFIWIVDMRFDLVARLGTQIAHQRIEHAERVEIVAILGDGILEGLAHRLAGVLDDLHRIAGDEGADDADNDIADQTEAVARDDDTGKPTGNRADNQKNDKTFKTHDKLPFAAPTWLAS